MRRLNRSNTHRSIASSYRKRNFSQAITGRLRGQILDPSGGAVPQAQVVVTNQRTGVTTTLATTSQAPRTS